MENKLTVEDLLKVIELYQRDLSSAVADKMVALAMLERTQKELEAIKKGLAEAKAEVKVEE